MADQTAWRNKGKLMNLRSRLNAAINDIDEIAQTFDNMKTEVLDDPAEWAKLVVDKFGADVVTLHLISTDRQLGDTSPNDAAKVIEEVLQAVKVPILIGSAGDPEKTSSTWARRAGRRAAA